MTISSDNIEYKIKVLGVWESDFEDIRCNAILYENDVPICNFIESFESDKLNSEDENEIKKFLYKNIEKYKNLPKISKCSNLLKDIFKNVCESETSMYHVDEEAWESFYADIYSNKDIKTLKKEVEKYNIQNLITFNDENWKIIGWGDLETAFNDDMDLELYKDMDFDFKSEEELEK